MVTQQRGVALAKETFSLLVTAASPLAASYLILDAAGVVDDANASGIGPDVQALDDLRQEDLHLLEL